MDSLVPREGGQWLCREGHHRTPEIAKVYIPQRTIVTPQIVERFSLNPIPRSVCRKSVAGQVCTTKRPAQPTPGYFNPIDCGILGPFVWQRETSCLKSNPTTFFLEPVAMSGKWQTLSSSFGRESWPTIHFTSCHLQSLRPCSCGWRGTSTPAGTWLHLAAMALWMLPARAHLN